MIKSHNKNFCPNLRIIKKCLESNREFWNKQKDSYVPIKNIVQSQIKIDNFDAEDSFYFPLDNGEVRVEEGSRQS